MKELSIEEKAKRYDNAIKLVNSKWYYKNQPCFINVSELFPEFKENKDENIRKWLIEYFKEYKSTGIEGFANGLKIDTIIDWLEKQSESNPYSGVSFKYNDHTWGMCARDNGVEILLDGKIKQRVFLDKIQALREMVNNDKKVEPKFKVGDFVINDYCKGKIIELTDDAYLLDTGQGIPFSCEHNIHLWTIEDAKDGDVLVASDGSIFIYKCQRDNGVVHYIALTPCNDLVINENDYSWESKNACHPATKEQRNLLFQRMKEDGYEWNYDTKSLNKITTTSKRQASEYCYILDYSTGKVFKHRITEDEAGLTTEELLKKYGFKENECHIMYSSNNLELKLLEN